MPLLADLILHSNDLSGPIPPELANMPSLYVVDLGSNQVSGPIPPEFIRSPLKILRLKHNNLSGPIPPELGQMPFLETLVFRGNNLTGPIPPELGQLRILSYLDLADNNLTGPIPPELGQLRNLDGLDLRGNGLSGPIPPELGNLHKLNWLDLSDNDLTGAVPPEWGLVPPLFELFLQDNRLDDLPDLSTAYGLSSLDVSNNRFSFEDLEPNVSLLARNTTFTYAPQDSIDTLLRRTSLEVVFTVRTGGTENEYQWYRNGQAITGETAAELRVGLHAPPADYHATVTHPSLPDLTLVSRPLASNTRISIEEEQPEVITFGLHPNYPNPFAGTSHIRFDVERLVDVRIMVYDMLGRKVHTLVDGPRAVGRHRVMIDASGFAPGLYHYSMQAGDYSETRAMTILR